MLFFFFAVGPKFFSLRVLATILSVVAIYGTVAIGEWNVILSGEFDLSVGSVLGIGMMGFTLFSNAGMHSVLSMLLVLAIGCLCGFMNGIITLKGKIPSFITTLGTMMFLRGFLLYSSGGFVSIFKGDEFIINAFDTWLGGTPLRSSVVLWITLVVLVFIFSSKTKLGVWMKSVGADPASSAECGINVTRVKLIAFILSGFFASLGGVMNAARFHVADPTAGSGLELDVIAIVVLGGTLLSGGFGSVLGVALGSVIISSINAGTVMMGVPGYFYHAIVGVILIIVAILNQSFYTRILGLKLRRF